LVGALLCVRALLGPAAAQAQDAAPDAQAQEPANPPGYVEAVAVALNQHEAGNYLEARAHFLRAHALYPNARTLRGLGKVEFELRNYGEAVRYLKEALSATAKPLDDELRAEAEKLLRRARLYVGEVHIDVDPSYATVSVDGAKVASGPKASFSLIVGDHVLEFQAQGRLSERRAISIRGGEQTVLQVVLPTPAVEQVAPPPAPLSNHRDDRITPLRKKWWLWTAVGVVAAGAAVGIALAARPDEQRAGVSGGTTNTVLVNQ
jgi:tetratricopeptide (TPR) repeat protein